MQTQFGFCIIALLTTARPGCGYLRGVCQQGECKELQGGCQQDINVSLYTYVRFVYVRGFCIPTEVQFIYVYCY